MKRLASCFTLVVVAVSVVNMAVAQPPEEPRRGPEAGPRGPGGPEFRPPSNPLMEAIDANGDGEVSAEELEKAAAALSKLDKNGDGKLTAEEFRPQFERTHGPRDSGAARGPESRDDNPFTSAEFIARVMELDKNEDGRVSKDEMPERMQGILRRADSNFDGAVDKVELEQAAERIRNDPRRGGEYRESRGSERPDRPSE